MAVKLSVKMSAVQEKTQSSSRKSKISFALSVKMGSVRATQLLQLERASIAFPGGYHLWGGEPRSTR